MGIVTLPDWRNIRRVLIIRLSSIGDVTHALPVSAALEDAYPHLEITWVVEEMSADIVAGNPYLKEVIIVPRRRWKQGRTRSAAVWKEYTAFLRDLRQRQFDLTLDLQGYAKSGLMALATGARYRFGWWRLRDGSGLVSRALPKRPESLHRVDWFLDAVRGLGIEPKAVRFPLAIPELARARVAELLCAQKITPGMQYAVLNPAAGNPARKWDTDRYAALAISLAQRQGLASVLIGSQKDVPLCEEIIARVQSATADTPSVRIGSLAGKTDLKELAAVLDGCGVHVCGDTGSAHIAAALGRPVVALYGPTDPAHAGPYGQQKNVLSHREWCRPHCTERHCAYNSAGENVGGTERPAARTPTEEGQEADQTRMARCLQAITVEEALEKVEQVTHGLEA